MDLVPARRQVAPPLARREEQEGRRGPAHRARPQAPPRRVPRGRRPACRVHAPAIRGLPGRPQDQEERRHRPRVPQRFFAAVPASDVCDVSQATLVDYLTKRANEDHLAPKTLNRIRQVLGTFFEWLLDQDLLEKNPVRRVKCFRGTRPRSRTSRFRRLTIYSPRSGMTSSPHPSAGRDRGLRGTLPGGALLARWADVDLPTSSRLSPTPHNDAFFATPPDASTRPSPSPHALASPPNDTLPGTFGLSRRGTRTRPLALDREDAEPDAQPAGHTHQRRYASAAPARPGLQGLAWPVIGNHHYRTTLDRRRGITAPLIKIPNGAKNPIRSVSFESAAKEDAYDFFVRRGRFYEGRKSGFKYYCQDAGDGDAVLYLVESYQHGHLVQALFRQKLIHANQDSYREITDRQEISRLKYIVERLKRHGGIPGVGDRERSE